MLSSKKRLSTPLFMEVLEKGSTFQSSFFIVKVLTGFKASKFSISIPKKVAKTAVSRNKIKRRIFSFIKSIESNMVIGNHVLIIGKSGLSKLSHTSLSKELHEIFVKYRLIK